jgi:hypothetical protein
MRARNGDDLSDDDDGSESFDDDETSSSESEPAKKRPHKEPRHVYVILLKESGAQLTSTYIVDSSAISKETLVALRDRHARRDQFHNKEDFRIWLQLYHMIMTEGDAFEALEGDEEILQGNRVAVGIYLIEDPNEHEAEISHLLSRK